MTRMITENPHFKRGNPPIGAREGMLFSDIRLHMAIARRTKNPHLFRPDLFHPAVEPTVETLGCLNQSAALAKVRYLSEVPVADTRHLQFMPHLADAVADLGSGLAIFDPILDRLETSEAFSRRLAECPNQERIDHHFRVVWTITENGGSVETRGLRKIGIPELKTYAIPEDERSVVSAVVEEFSGRLWSGAESLVTTHQVSLFGQLFAIKVLKRSLIEAKIVIGRNPNE